MLASVLMSMAPRLVPMVTGKAADVAIGAIANKLGVEPNEKAIEDHLIAHPEDVVQLEQINMEKLQAQLEDRQNAREMQKQAMEHDDPIVRRFVYLFAWFWAITSVGYFFAVTFVHLPESNNTFANYILGFLTGTAVATIIGFFYGGAVKGDEK